KLCEYSIFFGRTGFGQNIQSVQLFNPQTNDETPVIKIGEQLVLGFDDLTNGSQIYRYTFKHYDRNWNEDNLFFTEFATGSMNALLDQFQYSFNTLQAYTHYKLVFPNDKIQLKVSGNYELIVYKDSADKPLFKKRFYLVEDVTSVALNISRFADAKSPILTRG
ncbi:type IX secretion system plug protein domain-containing protein, partial [Chryseobacterium sp. CH1]|uniref:type IX secretion system plug protein n=1 Tax=Chryseobacterium sp. CH1 TaxID=713551 RepID=UPI001E4D8682